MYNHPPNISNDLDIQLARAYLWHVTWNGFFNKQDASDKSGCSLLRLNNAIKAGGPANVAQPGGQTLLTENVIVAVLNKLSTGAMSISAVPLEMNHPSGLLSIIIQEIQLQQSNPHAIPKPPDKKTYDAWVGIILSRGDCSIRSAELKAKGRKKPFLNLRNNVAFAAVMSCLFTRRNVHPELLLSTDDVSILIHPSMSDMKPVVIAPKVALKWLAENGIGVSVSAEELYKQRMLTFKITISRTYPVAIVIIVYDRSFEEEKVRPAIYDMGDHIYVALAHPGIDQQVLEEYIEQAAIEPQEIALR